MVIPYAHVLRVGDDVVGGPDPQRIAAYLPGCGIERAARTLALHQYQWPALVQIMYLVCEIDQVGLDVLCTAALV